VTSTPPVLTAVDPFDLPEWLGVADVTWAAEAGLRSGYAVPGHLGADGHDVLACDLLGVDVAYPVPVAADLVRHDAHQAWRHGQVLLVDAGGRLTLAVPGTGFTADLVLDALGRLAKAVGASEDHYSVRLRIGVERH
jgi:hypothetical protein